MSNDFDRTIIDVFFKRFSKVVIEVSRIICQIGLGVTSGYKTAGKSYKLAAEEGHANAQSDLGVMYAKGNGVTQDNVYAHMGWHRRIIWEWDRIEKQ